MKITEYLNVSLQAWRSGLFCTCILLTTNPLIAGGGSAVNKALDALIPIIVKAPADDKTRSKWLDRLWQAMADDGVDYLSPVGDRWGYEVTSADVVDSYDRALDAAFRLNKVDDVTGQIWQLVESNESASVLFIRQSLQGRMRAHSSSVNEMVASES